MRPSGLAQAGPIWTGMSYRRRPITNVIASMFGEVIVASKAAHQPKTTTITRRSRDAATCDLQDQVEKGALTRNGALRHTRYALKPSEAAE